jgi:hypothetical protein
VARHLTSRTLLTLLALVLASGVVRAQGVDGLSLFQRNWTAAETGSEGLGPLFNEASCTACHWFGGGARIRLSRLAKWQRLACWSGSPTPLEELTRTMAYKCRTRQLPG